MSQATNGESWRCLGDVMEALSNHGELHGNLGPRKGWRVELLNIWNSMLDVRAMEMLITTFWFSCSIDA
jgi:hypothetical protein